MFIRNASSNNESSRLDKLLRAPEASLSVIVVFAFTLVTIAATFAYLFTSRAIQTAESIDKSQELLGYLQTSLMTMNDMQLQADTYVRRGFVAAQSRYKSERSTLEECIQHVKRTGDEDGWRRWHLTYLELVAQKFQYALDSAIREKEAGNIGKATDSLSKSQKLLEVVRGRLIIIDVEERDLLKQRLSEYTVNTQRTSVTFLCLGAFIFLFVVPLTFLLQRNMRSSKKALLVEQNVSREIVKHAPIGILKLDTEFRIQDANGVFEGFMSKVNFPVGTFIWDLLPEMPREELTQTVLSGRPAILKGFSFTQLGNHKDQNVYWDIAAWPIVEESNVRSLIIMIEDITEKTILSHHKEVIQQTIAHDLKSPLIASNYIIQAVQKKLTANSNGLGDLILRLKDSNENALSMVKNMLEIAKYRKGAEILTMQSIVIFEEINQIVNSFEQRCHLANVTINVVAAEENISVVTDKSALTHLVSNLLENSIKFSATGDKVIVRLSEMEECVNIDVQNFGPGISESDRERLFTPYWQGELGLNSSGGTGIGLYLCKQISEALGGKISYKSNDLDGTTFTVSLPKVEDQDVQTEPSTIDDKTEKAEEKYSSQLSGT